MNEDECNGATSGTWQICTLVQDFGWLFSTEATTWNPRENILQVNTFILEKWNMCVIRLAQNLAVVHEHCIQPFVSLETWTFFSVRAGLIISLFASPCAIKLVIKQTYS
jgi:hypothetical protein